MKKALMILFLIVSSTYAKNVDVKLFSNIAMFDNPNVTLIKAYDHGSLYEVEFKMSTPQGVKLFNAYVTKDKKAFMMGSAYDATTKEPLRIPLDKAHIKKSADIVYGTGKEELIVFTDPECKYCQIFQTQWKDLQKNYTFYVFLYPMSSHSQALQMSYYVLSQKDDKAKAKALIDIASGNTSYKEFSTDDASKKRLNRRFNNSAELGAKLGVKGTPSVFTFSGDFVNWSTLK